MYSLANSLSNGEIDRLRALNAEQLKALRAVKANAVANPSHLPKPITVLVMDAIANASESERVIDDTIYCDMDEIRATIAKAKEL